MSGPDPLPNVAPWPESQYDAFYDAHARFSVTITYGPAGGGTPNTVIGGITDATLTEDERAIPRFDLSVTTADISHAAALDPRDEQRVRVTAGWAAPGETPAEYTLLDGYLTSAETRTDPDGFPTLTLTAASAEVLVLDAYWWGTVWHPQLTDGPFPIPFPLQEVFNGPLSDAPPETSWPLGIQVVTGELDKQTRYNDLKWLTLRDGTKIWDYLTMAAELVAGRITATPGGSLRVGAWDSMNPSNIVADLHTDGTVSAVERSTSLEDWYDGVRLVYRWRDGNGDAQIAVGMAKNPAGGRLHRSLNIERDIEPTSQAAVEWEAGRIAARTRRRGGEWKIETRSPWWARAGDRQRVYGADLPNGTLGLLYIASIRHDLMTATATLTLRQSMITT